MGHRKHSAPRRGSLAYYPRSRAHGLVPRVRAWAGLSSDSPTLGGFVGFKVGMLHLITTDDREKTPNFGKPLFVPATVLSVGGAQIFGVRVYGQSDGKTLVLKDAYDPEFAPASKPKKKWKLEDQVKTLSDVAKDAVGVSALLSVKPSDAGLGQKKPIVLEVPILGGDVQKQILFAVENIGKKLPVHKQLSPGQMVDVVAVSKGKGFEGPITRFGVKRKQHKSRKSVRAVGVLSPWHPHDVMYTVARAGQMGFHQRVEYNHKVMAVGDEKTAPITPPSGFAHFGPVRGDYIILKGSVPGPSKRPVIIRQPVRAKARQPKAPQLVYVSTRVGKVAA